MSDSNNILKAVLLMAVVAIFAVSLNDWDASAPDMPGWTNLQTVAGQDPFNGTPDWPTFPEIGIIEISCDWWDILCWVAVIGEATAYIGSAIVYFGLLVYTGIVWFFSGLIWLTELVVGVFLAAFDLMMIPFLGFPSPISELLAGLSVILLLVVVFAVIRFIRGQD